MTTPVNDPQSPVLLFEHQTSSGQLLAEARLNVEATLNSLSLAMIDILRPALDRWAGDERIAGVLLTGSGERAFSAGGDIQALSRAMVRNHEAGSIVDDYPDRFFEHEYRLDYRIHTYPKPVISIGHGVVMGGGLGIFSGARHRVVTEKSRIALPEVTIGLFPDAGATWLLRNMPSHVATFIATTGAHVNGADAVAVGIATHSVAAAERDRVREGLLQLRWSGASDADHDLVRDCLDAVAAAAPAPLPEAQTPLLPSSLGPAGDALDVAERVRALAGTSSWIDGGIATMNRGCPTSVGIAVQQLQRAGAMTLADTFRMEMIVATHCARHRDFAEGVRALIIDKDNRPQWQFGRLEDLPADYVDEHFTPPWPVSPLADLEGA